MEVVRPGMDEYTEVGTYVAVLRVGKERTVSMRSTRPSETKNIQYGPGKITVRWKTRGQSRWLFFDLRLEVEWQMRAMSAQEGSVRIAMRCRCLDTGRVRWYVVAACPVRRATATTLAYGEECTCATTSEYWMRRTSET